MKKFYTNIFITIAIIGIIIGLSSCSGTEVKNEVGTNKTENPEDEINPTPLTFLRITDKQEFALYKVNYFSTKIIKSLEESGEKNVFYSPISIASLVGMLANIADQEAIEEVKTAFYISDIDYLNDLLSFLHAELPNRDNQTTLDLANSIWLKDGYSLDASQTDLLKTTFNVEQYSISPNAAEMLAKINTWCSEKTHGMIPHFLDYFDPASFLAEYSAVYFNGKWATPFDAKNTKKGEFNGISGKKMVDKMEMEEKIRYRQSNNCKAISLPYGNHAYTLSIFLPDEGVSLAEILPDINTNIYFGDKIPCTLKLPKFEIEYSNTALKQIFEKLGLKHLFEASALNIEGENKNGNCLVSNKSKFRIDESGAVAADISGIYWASWNDVEREKLPDHVVFDVNRPFAFSITETTTTTVVFCGFIKDL